MEGWDGTPDGNPTDNTVRRWQRFGQSGAKLIWGGEAAAVNHAGRANPNQIVVAPHTRDGLARMRTALIEEHKRTMGSTDGLVIGLQLTHSGRYCRPNISNKPEPRILYRHPILDARLKLDSRLSRPYRLRNRRHHRRLPPRRPHRRRPRLRFR